MIYFRWAEKLIHDKVISLKLISIIYIFMFILTQYVFHFSNRISFNLGAFILPIILFIIAIWKIGVIHTVVPLLLIVVNSVFLNELLHAAPIAIIVSPSLMIATMSMGIGYYLVKNKTLGLLCSWTGIVLGDTVFQMIHYKQITTLEFGTYALLDILFLTSTLFLVMVGVHVMVSQLIKRRETSG